MNGTTLAKVRALLAKAESTQFPAEADALNAKAAELVAKHGIDSALLAARGDTTDEITHLVITIDNPYSTEKATLLTAVAESLRCKALMHKTGRTTTRCTVVGYRSDLERVELLYTSLLLQAVSQVVRQRPDATAFGSGVSTVTYRKSWFLGFATAVWHRLREAERQAAADAESSDQGAGVSTALVLRDRTSLVGQRFATFLRDQDVTTRTSLARSSEGYRHGKTAGQRADLGQPRVGARRPAVRSA